MTSFAGRSNSPSIFPLSAGWLSGMGGASPCAGAVCRGAAAAARPFHLRQNDLRQRQRLGLLWRGSRCPAIVPVSRPAEPRTYRRVRAAGGVSSLPRGSVGVWPGPPPGGARTWPAVRRGPCPARPGPGGVPGHWRCSVTWRGGQGRQAGRQPAREGVSSPSRGCSRPGRGAGRRWDSCFE